MKYVILVILGTAAIILIKPFLRKESFAAGLDFLVVTAKNVGKKLHYLVGVAAVIIMVILGYNLLRLFYRILFK